MKTSRLSLFLRTAKYSDFFTFETVRLISLSLGAAKFELIFKKSLKE